MIIDPVTNGFIPIEVKSNFYICDNSILTFGKRGLCLGFSNNSHVESLYRFRKSVVDKVKLDINNVLNRRMIYNVIWKHNMQTN